MNGHGPAALTEAARLAAWTRLRFETLSTLYTAYALVAAKDWKTLEAESDPMPDHAARAAGVIAAAFGQAQQHGFIWELALGITRHERQAGRSEQDIGELLTALSPAGGVMQAITDAAAGLLDPAIFEPLIATRNACAYVSSDGKIIGTGFLVAPDLALTSAHVVLQDGQSGKFLNKLRPKLKFTFRPDQRDPARQPIVRSVLGDTPVAQALPHGQPPNKLERQLGAEAARKLDFALVRLSSQVTHVAPIDITEPAEAENQRKCFVIGYPGGTAIMFDADRVTAVDIAGGRLLHLANTIAGMSGSCCVGPQGTPVGLHEGGFFRVDGNGDVVTNAKGQAIVENNRAVYLKNIRDALRIMRPDPLLAKPRSPGLGIYDPDLVAAWHRAGQRLAGSALESAWNQTVAAALGVDLNNIRDSLGFHPWFKRSCWKTGSMPGGPMRRNASLM